MNTVSLGEDVLCHFGVPSSGLVSEVNSCFQELLHGDYVAHDFVLSGFYPPRPEQRTAIADPLCEKRPCVNFFKRF